MSNQQDISQEQENPSDILGVAIDAGKEEIRAAYLRKVKEFPPDREPEQFERIRDAYENFNNPRRRMQTMLESVNPLAPLASLLDKKSRRRNFTGPEPWLAVLKEKSK